MSQFDILTTAYQRCSVCKQAPVLWPVRELSQHHKPSKKNWTLKSNSLYLNPCQTRLTKNGRELLLRESAVSTLRTVANSFALLVLLAAIATARFAAGPSPIEVSRYAWTASEIVVASSANEIGGRATILESLQGNLRSGDSIALPELTKFKSAKPRTISTRGYCYTNSGPFCVPYRPGIERVPKVVTDGVKSNRVSDE